MNTQSHLLLGAYLLARPGDADPALRVTARRHGFAAIAGSLAPDAGLYVMWIQAKLRGIPEATIWGELYVAPAWERVWAVTNSMPLYGLVALSALGLGARLGRAAHAAGPIASIALIFSLAALVHLATDLPLHVGDARPHFWPISDWIFRSPVSYWNPAHYGDIWAPIEIAASLVFAALLWRRFGNRFVRVALALAFVAYGATALYWTSTLA